MWEFSFVENRLDIIILNDKNGKIYIVPNPCLLQLLSAPEGTSLTIHNILLNHDDAWKSSLILAAVSLICIDLYFLL